VDGGESAQTTPALPEEDIPSIPLNLLATAGAADEILCRVLPPLGN
jgi:hypothetical protein